LITGSQLSRMGSNDPLPMFSSGPKERFIRGMLYNLRAGYWYHENNHHAAQEISSDLI
jgi:hypothetical protein